MKLAMAQMSMTGSIEQNLSKTLAMMERAAGRAGAAGAWFVVAALP